MKKKLLIFLGSIYTIIIVAAVVATVHYWSYISALDWSLINISNIKAVYHGFNEDPAVTAEKRKAIDSQRSEEIRKYIDMELREYTEEERRQIESGEKTETEILAQIISESVESATQNGGETAEGNQPEGDKSSNGEGKDNHSGVVNKNIETADQIVARHVSALYSIQGEFESRVASLAASASNWVKAYKKAHPEVTWKDAKVAGVSYFSKTASAIESECYAKVDAQIALLISDLKAIGADTSIAEAIRQSAYNEMETKKTQIVQQGKSKLNKND